LRAGRARFWARRMRSGKGFAELVGLGEKG
jgi:hypothetical protein